MQYALISSSFIFIKIIQIQIQKKNLELDIKDMITEIKSICILTNIKSGCHIKILYITFSYRKKT